MTTLINVCQGTCCKRFYISYDMIDRMDTDSQIMQMIIPLANNDSLYRKAGMMCTCRHFDTTTERCTIYSTRPMMCRAYPYGHEGGCDLDPDCHYTLDNFDLAYAKQWLNYLVYRWTLEAAA